MSDLYHYTCDHGRRGLGDCDQVHSLGGHGPSRYAWFTDLETPDVRGLGLTSHILKCDRTAYRYRVIDARDIRPWTEVRRLHPWATEIESYPGALPRHWFIAEQPVPVEYDPIGGERDVTGSRTAYGVVRSKASRR